MISAGVMLSPFKKTTDGFEEQFAVNHLGHMLLTSLLLDKLKATGSAHKYSRIVNVSSEAHRHSQIEWDNLNGE